MQKLSFKCERSDSESSKVFLVIVKIWRPEWARRKYFWLVSYLIYCKVKSELLIKYDANFSWLSNIYISIRTYNRNNLFILFFIMFQAFWAVFTLLYLAQIINSAPCGVTLVTPRKVVERVSRSGWLLVRGNSWEDFRKSLNIRPRQRRSIDQRKSRHCNWTDELDENVNRKPRFLHKAVLVCKSCSSFCKPVDFDHKVLVKDCNASLRTHRERMDVWKWETVTLPVAFVYNP